MTLLGIVIGVWAITSMQSVVNGFDLAMEQELSALGSETFVVQKTPAIVVGHNWHKYSRRKNFTYADAVYLEETSSNIQATTAVITTFGKTVKYKDKKTSPMVRIIGTMSGYMTTQSNTIGDGRFITRNDVDRTRMVAILGKDVVEELFPFEDPIGKKIIMGGQGFFIIGILEEAPSSFDQSADNIVIIPITTYAKVFTNNRRQMGSTGILVRAWDAESVDEAVDEAIALLRVRRKVPLGDENDFEVVTAESIMSTMNDFTFYIRVAALGIAGISLLVAGIGIMNIMLVSVMERTKEIGTRKAVGAKRRDILFQFLIEAVILSEFGALLGIVFGVLTAAAVSPLIKMPAAVPLWAMISALGYCSMIGIFFGLYPANKAAKLDPIEALRYE